MNARESAFLSLQKYENSGVYSNIELSYAIERGGLEGAEKALYTALFYGVIERKMTLDYYIAELSDREDIDLNVRIMLRIGLYQLIYMTKIPESAAVNEAVVLTKKYNRNPKASSLVNGVLRNAVRSKGQLKEPVSYADKYSHPEELISLLKANLPKGKLESMLIANNASPQTVVQVNTLKITPATLMVRLEKEHVTAHPHGWMPDCLILGGTGNLESLPSFKEGLFYVQDPAAKLSVLCARLPQADIRLLDCCSAPGGKSFAAAIAMEGKGQIISCDIHAHKTGLIANGADRLGLTNITARQQDATENVADWVGAMDVVIADVPCSGLGIIRKKPDIRYKNLAEMKELPALQLAILRNQATYVKPGGVLIYSTCTVLKQENEDVVSDFLKDNDDFYLEPLELPEVFPKNETGMLTLIPGEYDTDGFFISRLRRKA